MARRRRPIQRIGTPRIGGPPAPEYTTPFSPAPRDPGKFEGAFGATQGKRFGVFNPPPSFGQPATTGPTDLLRPPPGTYDPSLDAQQDAAERGYGDFQRDTELADSRARQDYGFSRSDVLRDRYRGRQDIQNQQGDFTQDWFRQRADLIQGRDRSLSDIMRDRTRGTEDYGLSKGRLGEDYTRAVSGLERQYGILGNQQGQAARAAGVAGGGALAQAAEKRAANQAWDRAPIDTGFQRQTADLDTNFKRFGEDSSQAETRLGEDFDRSTGQLVTQAERAQRDFGIAGKRLTNDADTALGRLKVGYQRGTVDRSTALGRAGRENRAFGQDIGAARFYQARQTMGGLPTYKPKPYQDTDPYSKRNRGKTPAWLVRR